MWFKKKSVLQDEGHYNSNTAVDGTDWRTTSNQNNWPVSPSLPSIADAGNYFYLPALGYYSSGRLNNVGNNGYYWSSSASQWGSNFAYDLDFDSGNVNVNNDYRGNGFRVDGFE